jgi:hypothetical protein
MDIPHQFEQVGILLAQNRFVPVLEQMAMALMAAVETDGVSGQKPAHNGGKGGTAGSQQQMKMVGDQCPRVTNRFGVLNNGTQPIEKIISVLIVQEYVTAFDTTHDYVVQGAGASMRDCLGMNGTYQITGCLTSL